MSATCLLVIACDSTDSTTLRLSCGRAKRAMRYGSSSTDLNGHSGVANLLATFGNILAAAAAAYVGGFGRLKSESFWEAYFKGESRREVCGDQGGRPVQTFVAQT